MSDARRKEPDVAGQIDPQELINLQFYIYLPFYLTSFINGFSFIIPFNHTLKIIIYSIQDCILEACIT